MPFRLDEFRAKVQFLTSAAMPSLIRKAAIKTGKPSNTVYIQHALCRALSEDLGIPVEDLLAELPTWRKSPIRAQGEPIEEIAGQVGQV